MALNSRMRSLMSAWNSGDMAVVQGLGYPDQNRSHFKSIALWETGGDGRQAGRNGWLTEDIEAMDRQVDAHGISLDGGMGVFASSSGLWISLTSLRQLKTLQDYQLEIGAGLGPLAGKVWRIGLMGYASNKKNVLLCLGALGSVLQQQGVDVDAAAAVAAAQSAYG